MRSWIVPVGLLLLSAPCLGQSTSDQSGMQALVAEVRLLRKDLQTANGNALKAQLLLNRLQLQQTAVARLAERLSDARGRLADTQNHQRALTAHLKNNEEALDNTEISPANRKEVQKEISMVKAELENLAAEEQQRQTAEMEAEEQLRAGQAKLDELESRMDRLEKELENPH